VTTILFAAEYYPPFAPGGAEWSSAAWARALARRGYRVVVVTPNYGAEPVQQIDQTRVIRVPFPRKLQRGQGEVSQWLHRILYPYFALQLARVARREDAAILHAQGKMTLVPAWIAGCVTGRPVVVTIRDLGLVCPTGMCPLFEDWNTFDCRLGRYARKCVPFFLAHYERDAGWLRRLWVRCSSLAAWLDLKLRQLALRRVRGIIAVSEGIRTTHPERLVGRERSVVVHNLPPEVSVPSDEDAARARAKLGIPPGPLVLYVGKRSLGKGTEVLLAALDSIRAVVPGVRFAFAGKGDLPLPAAPDIHALGSLPQRDALFPLYRAADVVVVPSVWPEPLSRVLLEAMRLGRPIVATAVGGTPETVEHGVTGLLVPKQDPEALAKAVAELLLDPGRRERMGRAAAERAERLFGEDRLVGELVAAYQRASGPAR
jgi:glycosyltransferase involved in cell wall biosynthesis